MDKFSLQGKAAIVTGAAGGIGAAIAKAFKEAGAQVACVDLNVLQTGSVIAAGTCEALKQDPRVKEAYLGRR